MWKAKEGNPTFDPKSSKYQICCGCHVLQGLAFICLLGIICASLLSLSVSLGLFIALPLFYIYYSAIVGIRDYRTDKLIPLIVLMIISLVGSIAQLIYIVSLYLKDNRAFGDDKNVVILIFACFTAYISLNLWFLWIAIRCHEYLNGMKQMVLEVLLEEQKLQGDEIV